MTEITGSDVVIGFKVQAAASFGTATACGSSDKMEVESLSQSTNPSELTANPIGSGQNMANDSQVGAESPTVSIEKLEHFNDAGTVAEAVFWQGASVVTWGATGAYSHSLTHSETWNQKFGTLAQQFQVGSVMEHASCAVTGLKATYSDPPNYGKLAFELLANGRKTTGTTNTYSSLETCTLADTERLVVDRDDTFQINLQTDGALTTTHNLAVTNIEISYEKPQEHSREIRGTAGNGIPTPSGSPPFAATISFDLKRTTDITFFTGYTAGTEWKATLTVTGATIGGGVSKRIKRHFPRLKLVTDVDYGLATAAVNPMKVTLKCLVVPSSSSIPAGMFDRYPHVEIVNTRTTSLLA
jgi:hypothetical protein